MSGYGTTVIVSFSCSLLFWVLRLVPFALAMERHSSVTRCCITSSIFEPSLASANSMTELITYLHFFGFLFQFLTPCLFQFVWVSKLPLLLRGIPALGLGRPLLGIDSFSHKFVHFLFLTGFCGHQVSTKSFRGFNSRLQWSQFLIGLIKWITSQLDEACTGILHSCTACSSILILLGEQTACSLEPCSL